jgi:hypothetical protein
MDLNCGGAAIPLEDGTPRQWLPGALGLKGCLQKCSANLDCVAFVWNVANMTCVWQGGRNFNFNASSPLSPGSDCYMKSVVPVLRGECSVETLDQTLYHRFFDEMCLQELHSDTFGNGVCPVVAANNLLGLLLGQNRVEGWAVGVLLIVLLISCNFLFIAPDPKDSVGTVLFFGYQAFLTMQWLLVVMSIFYYCWGYFKLVVGLTPCMVDYGRRGADWELMNIVVALSFVFQAAIMNRMCIMLG